MLTDVLLFDCRTVFWYLYFWTLAALLFIFIPLSVLHFLFDVLAMFSMQCGCAVIDVETAMQRLILLIKCWFLYTKYNVRIFLMPNCIKCSHECSPNKINSKHMQKFVKCRHKYGLLQSLLEWYSCGRICYLFHMKSVAC